VFFSEVKDVISSGEVKDILLWLGVHELKSIRVSFRDFRGGSYLHHVGRCDLTKVFGIFQNPQILLIRLFCRPWNIGSCSKPQFPIVLSERIKVSRSGWTMWCCYSGLQGGESQQSNERRMHLPLNSIEDLFLNQEALRKIWRCFSAIVNILIENVQESCHSV
jgi:hypothetical protein